jgi:hypothetical protein
MTVLYRSTACEPTADLTPVLSEIFLIVPFACFVNML